ncbi:hypothetical protein FPOAC1_001245 [Fusarium poae]|uniref:hypothetical protein n=1 Tax=Fusarium poae TaxID=36050 RepID=UPI001CE9FB78|nr:hypothetical protein FPOAC1_001245 [Fusarium poae]KAG8675267.1 hypothetical protein FPOAC1_001245 [Fusarium poae]
MLISELTSLGISTDLLVDLRAMRIHHKVYYTSREPIGAFHPINIMALFHWSPEPIQGSRTHGWRQGAHLGPWSAPFMFAAKAVTLKTGFFSMNSIPSG